MSAKRYELVTTSCLVAAVVSSFLYGKSGSLNWLALSLGVAAAITAVSIYFYNARSVDNIEAEDRTQLALPDMVRRQDAAHVARPIEGEHVRLSEVSVIYKANSQSCFWDAPTTSEPPARIRYYALYHKRLANELSRKTLANEIASPRRPFRERQLFLDEVVELVNRLAPTCEIELSLEGRLTIKPIIRTSKAFDEAPGPQTSASQEITPPERYN
jgi:hypothetical protein